MGRRFNLNLAPLQLLRRGFGHELHREEQMAKQTEPPTVADVLERFRRIDREPEVVAAAERVEQTRRRVGELDAKVKALADQIAEAEEAAAERILSSGYQPTGEERGEDLTPLRIARRKARDELKVAESAWGKARQRLKEARAAAAERLRPQFHRAYKALVTDVLEAVDAAAEKNQELQELELAARQVLGSGNVPGSFVFTRLLPSTPMNESLYEYWRGPVLKFLGRDS